MKIAFVATQESQRRETAQRYGTPPVTAGVEKVPQHSCKIRFDWQILRIRPTPWTDIPVQGAG